MKSIEELNLGYTDAQNYTQKANKTLFNEIFVRNRFLDQLISPSKYFLIGEKGTGKTAYSVYLKNNNYKENKTTLTFISATDYEKFYTLKEKNKLGLTDYTEIWKIILLLILSKTVIDDKSDSANKECLIPLSNAINEYYMNAFSPDIVTALKIVDATALVAELVQKNVKKNTKDNEYLEFSDTRLTMNLYYIEKQFEDAIRKLKLRKNYNLIIDGIDIRPNTIPYKNYSECIRGLADACWALNTELFQNVKDSRGYLKVVLLLRPDIFSNLNLQNATNKIRDNAVFLDWKTTYTEYKDSNLYQVSNTLLGYQQREEEDLWEKYLPWKLQSTSPAREYDTAFMEFLRISLSRPRDILVILQLIKEQMLERNLGKEQNFSLRVYQSDKFQNAYSEYFMSSLKDQLSFYYSSDDFDNFVKFFDYFDGSEFSYQIYINNYNKFVDYILENAKEVPEFVDSANDFLQLLYDSNIIAALETKENGGVYYHFSYREKSISNIKPKVPIDENVAYKFHYGLYKKTKLGRF